MNAPYDHAPASAVRLPSDPQLLLLRAKLLSGIHMRRARTRASDADPDYTNEFPALHAMTELGFIDPERLERWRAECLQRFEDAEAAKLNKQVRT